MFQDEPDLVGQVLQDRYGIERKISRGIMGIVYYAWDQIENRHLAIKVLLPREADQIDLYTRNLLLERFTRERRILIGLRHQHIVPLYDIGQHNDMMYFVMQYCSGGTLYRKLHETERNSSPEILRYITQAASALDFIHDNNIIHRDIKPQNFLLDAVGKLLLSDFGVAHIIGSTLTTSGQPWGTGAYASPEVQRSETPDPRDDIYSLGVILYEMMTRNHPRMLRKLRRDIPPEIDEVINKATAIRRRDRYSSARSMAEDLERAIKDGRLDSEEKTTPSAQTPPTFEQASHNNQVPGWRASADVRQNRGNRQESQTDRTPYRQAPAMNQEVLFQSIPLLSSSRKFCSNGIVPEERCEMNSTTISCAMRA